MLLLSMAATSLLPVKFRAWPAWEQVTDVVNRSLAAFTNRLCTVGRSDASKDKIDLDLYLLAVAADKQFCFIAGLGAGYLGLETSALQPPLQSLQFSGDFCERRLCGPLVMRNTRGTTSMSTDSQGISWTKRFKAVPRPSSQEN